MTALVAQLGSDDPGLREQAEEQLERLGEESRDALLAARASTADLEVQWRATRVLRSLDLSHVVKQLHLSYTQDGSLYVVDLPEGTPRKLLDSWTGWHDWMPDGKRIICCHTVGGSTHRARFLLVDPVAATSNEIALGLGDDEEPMLAVPSQSGRFLAVATRGRNGDGELLRRMGVLDLTNAKFTILCNDFAATEPVYKPLCLSWSAEERLLYCGSEGQSMFIAAHDAASAQTTMRWGPSERRVFAVAPCFASNRIAAIVYTGKREHQKALVLIDDSSSTVLYEESDDEYVSDELEWADGGTEILIKSRSGRPISSDADRKRVLAVDPDGRGIKALSDDRYLSYPTFPRRLERGASLIYGKTVAGTYGLWRLGDPGAQSHELQVSGELTWIDPRPLGSEDFIPVWVIKRAGAPESRGCSLSRLPYRNEVLSFGFYDPETQRTHHVLKDLEFTSSRLGEKPAPPFFDWRIYRSR